MQVGFCQGFFAKRKTRSARAGELFRTFAPGEIAALFVGPSCQHKGHAGALLTAAKELYGRLEVWVYIQNETALHFFEHSGFAPLREKTETETKLKKVLMVWPSCPNTL